MSWTADIATEPSRSHQLCVDLFEGDVHRARIHRTEQGEVELVCYAGGFSIPAEWLMGLIQRFISETDLTRRQGGV